ncbi:MULTISPECIES: hypothetical protein [unclassified Haloarcula]|uniref:hypothetical protein n=1 Tax=unclassified Haloarcula TaxID=2624677 RepID=UPI00073E8D83|nr:hypothetical protein [Haloarcula sp. CBA1127]
MSGDSGRAARLLDGSTDPLTTDGGTSVDWKSVLMASLGAISTAYFSSAADLIGTFFQSWIIGPASEYATVMEKAVGLLVQSPGVAVDAAFQQTERFIDGLGIFAFIGALAFVVLMALVLAEARSRL